MLHNNQEAKKLLDQQPHSMQHKISYLILSKKDVTLAAVMRFGYKVARSHLRR